MMTALLHVAVAAALWAVSADAFLPAQNPPWAPTYKMNLSTIAMMWNTDGPLDTSLVASFGIISIDWSNNKSNWVLQRPMDDEEDMVRQAEVIKRANPDTRVFVYRNLVKALPWWKSVRTILEDPAYEGFFLKFKAGQAQYHVPPCTTNANKTKCSMFYHDQEQTPAVPSSANPHPDGVCNVSCDCGETIPCGEYLWDHRNASLTEWLMTKFIVSETAVGSPVIDGLFIDDFWCSDILNGGCSDPVQGPTEINRYSQVDMGLSDEDIYNITLAWERNMQAAQTAILNAGGYTWCLMPGQNYANAGPNVIYQGSCSSYLTGACTSPNPNNGAPILHGLQGRENYEQQTAVFLLARGPYGWIGWGLWGMLWPPTEPLPAVVWGSDYGAPLEDSCRSTAAGVFTRRYEKANITLNCNSWQATFDFLA